MSDCPYSSERFYFKSFGGSEHAQGICDLCLEMHPVLLAYLVYIEEVPFYTELCAECSKCLSICNICRCKHRKSNLSE